MTALSLTGAFRRISGLTGLSRVFGFVRDVTFATFLGAGPAADAFVVALKLPNMFRRLTAEGALANAFVPTFADVRSSESNNAAMHLAGEIQTTLIAVLLGLVVIAEIAMPTIVALLAPGFAATPDRFDAAVGLARVTFPYLPMISMVAFWAAIANAHNRFSVAAAMPVIFNICLILAALMIPRASGWLASEKAMPLAVALLVAGVIQLLVMAATLHRAGILPVWRRPRFVGAARKMWSRFVTASAGAVAMQVNLIIDLMLASLLPVGAISWLYYADRVAQLPLGIIGIALGTILLPRLSTQFRETDIGPARETLVNAILVGAFFALPAASAMILIAEQITTGLFRHGAFTISDATGSALALAAYAVGLPGHLLIKIFQPAFYAMHRPAFVLTVSLIVVAINIIFSLSLMPIFGHVGLALATSISGLVGAAILSVAAVKAQYIRSLPIAGLVRITVATAVMLLALFAVDPFVVGWHSVLRLAMLVLAGGVSYFGMAYLLRAIPTGLLRG